MMFKRIAPSYALMGPLMAVLFLFAAPASAVTVWTDWISVSDTTPGASGLLNGVTVTYSGQVIDFVINGTSNIWSPNSSFIGGTVTASPSTVGDDIRLNGIIRLATGALFFSSPVVNPVFAIWSLGSPSTAASFTFNATPTLEAGGPNSQFGGSSIVVNGNTLSGNEGNGVVEFTGTFNSITWSHTIENFYAFTVGVNGPSGPTVPEPSMWLLLGSGLGGLFVLRRHRQT